MRKRTPPKASRPHMPGYGIVGAKSGKGLLPWRWARERLTKARRYWLATTRPDAQPHVMPVWGLWLDEAFYFSTGRQSRKGRNLAKNPRCVACVERGGDAVIVEGVVAEVRSRALLGRFARGYLRKYEWDVSEMEEPVYAVRPRVVFGLREKDFTSSATRWVFRKG